MSNGWQNVNKKMPCEICGKGDWCSHNSDWIVCRREKREGAIERCGTLGDYFLYKRQEGAFNSADGNSAHNKKSQCVEKADDQTLNIVYSQILQSAFLSANHLAQLCARGLSEGAAIRNEYKSIGPNDVRRIVADLRAQFSPSLLSSVPGFYDSKNPEIWFSSSFGLLIPVRNLQGEIIALKVRRENVSENKYVYVSSKARGGTSPGSPTHFPLISENTFSTVRITEGELKADIATELSREYTVGLPSVSAWRSIEQIVINLKPERVLLAFDMDADTNPHVAMALLSAVDLVKQMNIKVEVEKWK